MIAKRINILWTVLGVACGMALGAWYAGSRIELPAERAARTAPPEPSPILVPVESRVLTSDVVTRGTVRFGLPQQISIAPSTVKGGVGLIATLPRPNTGFQEGVVILSVSGRPVFILRGATPTYRDMLPGMSGGDVRQLEEALARLGFDPGTVDGIYDQKTSAAVERWYRKAGWDPIRANARTTRHRRRAGTGLVGCGARPTGGRGGARDGGASGGGCARPRRTERAPGRSRQGDEWRRRPPSRGDASRQVSCA